MAVAVDPSEAQKPISLLYFMDVVEEELPLECLDIFDKLFDSQDAAITAYVENNPDSPRLSSQRGIFFFHQVGDRTLMLGTSQWPSIACCRDWFLNNEPAFLADLVPSYLRGGREIMLMEGLMFPEAASDDSAALSNAPRLEITRWRVPLDKKDNFNIAVQALERRRKENDPQSTTFGAWQLEDWPLQPASEIRTYVTVSNLGGSETTENEPLQSFQEETMCNKLSTSAAKKHYDKALLNML